LYVQRGLPGTRWSRPELIDDQSCPSAGNLLVADLDGNGRADVARGGVGCGLRIRYQLSDGTLGPAQQLSNAPHSALKAADLNGDGRKDLVAIGGSTYRVWLQNRAGQLVLQTARELDFPRFGGVNGLIDLHMRGLEIGDMNGDGRLDIVVTLYGHTDPRRLMILHQRVDGTWSEPFYDTKGGGDSFALGDLNGDGRLDLAFTGGYVLQQADGSFGPVVMFPEEFAFGNYAVTLADIDSNGLVDIISRSTIESSVRIVVQRQQIGGVFAPPEIYRGGGYNEGPLFAIDLNGDRMIDVIDGLTLLMQIGSEQPTLAQSNRASPARAMNAAAKQQPASVTASWPSKLRAHWRH
ncbi:MAG: VCBS repeat-containing protein, partial [Hydrogenophaga sp.]|uniref:FG-GAP repeat domain-containing protein n=1 Tax=Hydrogenophaga sp. TaxID=1904254 RepID=UPI002ABA6B15